MDNQTFREGLKIRGKKQREEFFWKVINEARMGNLNDEQEGQLLATIREEEISSITIMLIMATPFFMRRREAAETLIAFVGMRDDVFGKLGLIQAHACLALSKIGERSALPSIRRWRDFLQKAERSGIRESGANWRDPESHREMVESFIRKAQEAIGKLERATGPEGI